jgi:hypothetical protein
LRAVAVVPSLRSPCNGDHPPGSEGYGSEADPLESLVWKVAVLGQLVAEAKADALQLRVAVVV